LTARVNPTILGAMLRIARAADGRLAAMKGSTYGQVGCKEVDRHKKKSRGGRLRNLPPLLFF